MLPTIQEVKEKHEARILRIKGVISVGIGFTKDKNPAIIVGLDRDNKDAVRRIPSVLDGYPVEIQIIGAIKAH